MSNIETLRQRADRSRRRGYSLSVVSSPEEARALAQAVGERLAALSDDERLLLLANLDDVQRSLGGRMARLDAEMAQARIKIAAVNRSLSACGAYAAGRPSRGARRGARRGRSGADSPCR